MGKTIGMHGWWRNIATRQLEGRISGIGSSSLLVFASLFWTKAGHENNKDGGGAGKRKAFRRRKELGVVSYDLLEKRARRRMKRRKTKVK